MTQKHGITFGDLILVEGYADRPFFVDSWTVETVCLPESTYTETWFDITCAHTGEYMMAELADIKRICGAEAADDYLTYHATPIENTIGMEMDDMFGYEPYEPKKKQPSRNPELDKQREEERIKAQVDKLLDDYNDAMALAEVIPEDAEKYREKAGRIIGRLEKLTE